MTASSLQTLVERVANRAGVLREYTTTSGGTTTTAISTALWEPAKFHEGGFLYVKTTSGGAAPQGEERPISTSVVGTLTVPVAFSGSVPTGATIQVYSRWSRAQIVTAINSAVRQSAGHWFQRVTDTSITTQSSVYSHDLSSLTVPVEQRHGLLRVEVQRSTAIATYPYDTYEDWELRWAGSTPTLQLLRPPGVGFTLRLWYISSPSTMASASSTTGVDPTTHIDDFLTEWALFELFQVRAGLAPSSDRRTDMQLAQTHRDEAERIRNKHHMQMPAKTLKPSRLDSWDAPDEGRWLAGFTTPSA